MVTISDKIADLVNAVLSYMAIQFYGNNIHPTEKESKIIKRANETLKKIIDEHFDGGKKNG